MTDWQRIVRWTDWQGNGLEHLSVVRSGLAITAEGIVTGQRDAMRYGLCYRVCLDQHWRVRKLDARTVDGPMLRLLSDGLGRWRSHDRAAIATLDGCIDVDIAATPFTNTLPIRRLGLAIGAVATIKVVFVSLPDLAISAVEQRYTRLGDARYLYEGLSTGFSAELDVDDQGIVLDYPDTFRRVQ